MIPIVFMLLIYKFTVPPHQSACNLSPLSPCHLCVHYPTLLPYCLVIRFIIQSQMVAIVQCYLFHSLISTCHNEWGHLVFFLLPWLILLNTFPSTLQQDCVLSFSCVSAQFSIMNAYHNFFIHLSATGRFGWFHILEIVQSAVINLGVHLYFRINILAIYKSKLILC